MNPPAAPRSLCILRLSALGDATHMVPLVRTLQRAWPALPITWIIGKGEAKLLEGLEGVEFLVFDKKSGWAGLRALREGRVCEFNAAQRDILVRPGPRMPEAARLMADCAARRPLQNR